MEELDWKKKGILVVRYVTRPSLKLRSHSGDSATWKRGKLGGKSIIFI